MAGSLKALLLRVAVTVAVAVLWWRAPMQAQQFEVGCDHPHLPTAQDAFGSCPIYGDAGHQNDAIGTQDRVKNNFCASGAATSITMDDFSALQTAVEKKGGKIRWGSGQAKYLPPDRSVLQGIGPNGLGEGEVVRFAGYILKAQYSNVSSGESVNCKRPGDASNDIHIMLSDKPGDKACNSVTAEMSPHYRPDAWTPGNLQSSDHPIRVTGQLFFDASHKPCANGKSNGPARRSEWEIHPVYGIEVCTDASLENCSVDDDSKWTVLAAQSPEGSGGSAAGRSTRHRGAGTHHNRRSATQ